MNGKYLVNSRILYKLGGLKREGGLFQILTQKGGLIREGGLIELLQYIPSVYPKPLSECFHKSNMKLKKLPGEPEKVPTFENM